MRAKHLLKICADNVSVVERFKNLIIGIISSKGRGFKSQANYTFNKSSLNFFPIFLQSKIIKSIYFLKHL